MTALVSLDFINLFSNVNLTASALAAWGTAGELKVGESLPAKDLLYPLLLESSNDAGEALAESSGRELFIKRMNDRAVAIGLTNTNYNDPTGLSDRNTSTVSDLFLLARHIYVNKRFVFDITKADGYKFGSHNWLNINPFHLMAGFIGGKSGETNNARQAYVNIFNQTLAYGEKRNIAIILLHSEDRDGDTKKFINYLTNNVEFK
jgi:D-alanyl-D-alanine carboxypeptidase